MILILSHIYTLSLVSPSLFQHIPFETVWRGTASVLGSKSGSSSFDCPPSSDLYSDSFALICQNQISASASSESLVSMVRSGLLRDGAVDNDCLNFQILAFLIAVSRASCSCVKRRLDSTYARSRCT